MAPRLHLHRSLTLSHISLVLNERMLALEAEMRRFEANCDELTEYQASLYKVAEIWVPPPFDDLSALIH